MRISFLASLAAGLVLGGAGFGATWAAMPGEKSAPVPGDRVQTAIAALKKDHLYIGPEERWRFTPDQVTQLQQAVTHARVPTYLVYWDGYDGDWGVDIDSTALDQIRHAIGHRGYYLMAGATNGFVNTDAIGYAPPFSDDLDNPAQPGPGLVTFLHGLDQDDPEPPWSDDSPSRGPDIVGGVFAGLGGAAALTLLVWLVCVVRRRWA